MGVLEWYDSIWGKRGDIQNFVQTVPAMANEEMLENYWKAQSEATRGNSSAIAAYEAQKAQVKGIHAKIEDPLKTFISGALDDWLKVIEKYSNSDPQNAKENLSKLSAHVIEVAAGTAAIDMIAGTVTLSGGEASSNNMKELMKWLGFGAVLTAIAHDPVKIGLLRPYQDSLEMTFRNKRPDAFSIMQSYTQRSLSPTRIDDPDQINDDLMTRVENENDAKFDEEMARHGYNQWFINVLKDTSTKTLTFSNLAQLAKMGHYNRGLATYSLWGMGLDRRLMKAALDTLDRMNEVSQFEGFRSMIEPSYVEGDIGEAEIIEYYNAISVPVKVQQWILPRLRKRREANLLKQKEGAPAKERDLTVSQLQQAYQNQLMDRAHAQNYILTLGYSLEEAKILLDLAEMRRKLPGAATLKRLPLSDYEKAFKNKLITQDKVLERMRGEYSPEDIDLERKLLESGKA